MGIVIVIVVIIVVLVLAFAAWRYTQTRRTATLRDQYGPEYDRAVEKTDDRRQAESELQERRERVDQVKIQPLSGEDRDRFANEWKSVQAQFVDDPAAAVGRADALITEVMSTLGYPAGSFEHREDAASARYPDVAENYRSAHEIAVRQQNGEASTEDLRGAMVQYRSLFEKLVGMSPTQPTEVPA